jgi:hypothetical protein
MIASPPLSKGASVLKSGTSCTGINKRRLSQNISQRHFAQTATAVEMNAS